MPGEPAWELPTLSRSALETEGGWEPDPLVLDEQAVVVQVRGQGLVVLTGCGHAGAVNTARHALRLTGSDRLRAMLGGFHLTGPRSSRSSSPAARRRHPERGRHVLHVRRRADPVTRGAVRPSRQ
jgi:metal-dependent hydrolase (beta-lactamase superfamily II)